MNVYTDIGPPQTGTYQVYDVVMDGAGTLWICDVAGTPGSWRNLLISPSPISTYDCIKCKSEFSDESHYLCPDCRL